MKWPASLEVPDTGILTHRAGVAHALWVAGIALWVVVMYAFFTATVIRQAKPSLETGINGAWLLGIVATQSVSVLGTLLAARMEGGREAVLFFTLCMYLLGAMLYLTIITLIFYRFTFVALSVDQMTPPYWINMGAVAITALAGSTLLIQADRWPFLVMLRPFLAGFTLFFWAAATVDSPADYPRRVAARRAAIPARVRPAVLGHRVSNRHVYRLHLEAGPGHGAGLSLRHSARHCLLRAGGVGRHVHGNDAAPLARDARKRRSPHGPTRLAAAVRRSWSTSQGERQ